MTAAASRLGRISGAGRCELRGINHGFCNREPAVEFSTIPKAPATKRFEVNKRSIGSDRFPDKISRNAHPRGDGYRPNP
jgi:hypothetical protein